MLQHLVYTYTTWMLIESIIFAVAIVQIQQPNIVVFLVDDLGWQDTSVPFHSEVTPFNELYNTPNWQRLADNGTKYTNAYAAGPVCTPSRTSLLTGQSPARTHITYWTLYKDKDNSKIHSTLSPPNWDLDALQPGDVTLPALLQKAGYYTMHVGKAHLGAVDSAGGDPENLGFDVNVAGHGAGGPGSFYGKHRFMATRGKLDFDNHQIWDVPGLEKYHDKEIFLSEALAIEACNEIEQAVKIGKPFFLHFAPYAVHAPLMPNPKYIAKYIGIDKREAAYATMIESADAALGSVLDTLDKLNIADNTIVIFTSDNGGLSAHARGGKVHTHNAPLRSGKGSAYEGGIRVPLIVQGLDKKPSINTANIITHDLFPTIIKYARATIPEGHIIDGVDLDKPNESRISGWHQPHQWGASGPGIEPFTAIRQGKWKLIFFHDGERYELYDLEIDIGETNNVCSTNQEVCQLMQKQLAMWAIQRNAQPSILTETGEAIEW
jgi:arylsulfatase A-like enzyme